jgi:hypothetical protein
MLTFHPEYRITVDEALEHPYLEELHSQVRIAHLKYRSNSWQRLPMAVWGSKHFSISWGWAAAACARYAVRA